eukprot:1411347-Amphidinium_carterae.1
MLCWFSAREAEKENVLLWHITFCSSIVRWRRTSWAYERHTQALQSKTKKTDPMFPSRRSNMNPNSDILHSRTKPDLVTDLAHSSMR